MTAAPSPETRAAQRRAAYDFNVAHAALARKAQADYGRWCLTALLLVHAGTIAFASGGEAGAWSARSLASCGLALTLFAGLLAWINWTLMADVHTRWADDRLLDPHDMRPVDEPRLRKRIADIAWVIAMASAAMSSALAPLAIGQIAE